MKISNNTRKHSTQFKPLPRLKKFCNSKKFNFFNFISKHILLHSETMKQSAQVCYEKEVTG